MQPPLTPDTGPALGAVNWRQSPGLTPYPVAVAEMEARVRVIHESRAESRSESRSKSYSGPPAAGAGNELVWLVEHPPLYTAGTSARAADLLDDARFEVFASGRGGQHTYHGPGQRVAYVMLDLKQRQADVRRYVRELEEWMIQTLAVFDVAAGRREGRVGIWVARGDGSGLDDKIGAIGVRVRHWVSFHGLSLNVNPDLSHYGGIVPCGISEHGVTSLQALGIAVTMAEVDTALRRSFENVFGRQTASTA